jgi:hypothetical protein
MDSARSVPLRRVVTKTVRRAGGAGGLLDTSCSAAVRASSSIEAWSAAAARQWLPISACSHRLWWQTVSVSSAFPGQSSVHRASQISPSSASHRGSGSGSDDVEQSAERSMWLRVVPPPATSEITVRSQRDHDHAASGTRSAVVQRRRFRGGRKDQQACQRRQERPPSESVATYTWGCAHGRTVCCSWQRRAADGCATASRT